MGSLQASLTPQTWARVGGGYTQEQGKDRLAYKSKAKFVQIGSDLFVNSNENGVRRGGVMASFNRADKKFYDKYHAQNGYIVADKLVGKGKLETATLGLYSTWYGNNGLYLDTTANVGWIGRNTPHKTATKRKITASALWQIPKWVRKLRFLQMADGILYHKHNSPCLRPKWADLMTAFVI